MLGLKPHVELQGMFYVHVLVGNSTVEFQACPGGDTIHVVLWGSWCHGWHQEDTGVLLSAKAEACFTPETFLLGCREEGQFLPLHGAPREPIAVSLDMTEGQGGVLFAYMPCLRLSTMLRRIDRSCRKAE